MGVKGHLRQTSFELMQKLVIRSPICKNKILSQSYSKKNVYKTFFEKNW